jgi:hypothetical protein
VGPPNREKAGFERLAATRALPFRVALTPAGAAA